MRVKFDNQSAKSRRLEFVRSLRSLLTPPGLRRHSILSALLNLLKESVPASFHGVSRTPVSLLPVSSCASQVYPHLQTGF